LLIAATGLTITILSVYHSSPILAAAAILIYTRKVAHGAGSFLVTTRDADITILIAARASPTSLAARHARRKCHVAMASVKILIHITAFAMQDGLGLLVILLDHLQFLQYRLHHGVLKAGRSLPLEDPLSAMIIPGLLLLSSLKPDNPCHAAA